MSSYNSKVERHSFGIANVSEYGKISEGAAASEYLQQKAVKEQYSALEQGSLAAEKAYETQQVTNKIIRKQLLESQIPDIINTLSIQGKATVFKDILFEMFSGALVLDEDFVLQQEDNLRALVEAYVDGKGGYALLENAVRTTKSPFLTQIKTICEATARKVARRKLSEAQTNALDVSAINFELNDEERQELEYDKEKISVDELSSLVQKKVLTVVQDEKSRQAKEQEIYNDLQAQAEGGEESVEESIKRSLIKDMPVEESTLFNSLFRNSYKEALESALSASTTEDEDDDVNPDEYNVNGKADSEADSHGSVQSDIDMDLILAESITKYTLMELTYSIQLESYNYDDIRKISQKLLR